jgi:gluconokinase
MFPVFKVAAMEIQPGQRIVSPKAWLVGALTGVWVEDHGMASASGMFNLRTGTWDEEIVGLLNLPPGSLPPVADRETIVGAHRRIPVVNGTADGFMATMGSGCHSSGRVAVSIGTTASARTTVVKPITTPPSGTFCYRANEDSFLLGCASNNGGNVLDWARRVFGQIESGDGGSIPIFLPMMYGERSLDWNAKLRASWHDVGPESMPAGLKRSVLEGVVFNLAHYIEVLESASGHGADQVILSGNGFREPALAPILAALVRGDVLLPPAFGMATLRGVAALAWSSLGRDPAPALEAVVASAERIERDSQRSLPERFARYKQLRGRAMDL